LRPLPLARFVRLSIFGDQNDQMAGEVEG